MTQYTYKEAVQVAKQMGSSEPLVLIRVLQVFGLLTLEAEPEEGLPVNFTFPFDKRNEWTDCCNTLRKQGFKIIWPNENREAFRQACSDLGHDEATVYGHWALKAYDVAHTNNQL